MPLILPEKLNHEVTPSGSHIAVCYRVIDLGTQLVEFKGEKKFQHKIQISWELPNELMKEGGNAGKPFSVHKQYTLSSSDKATLKKDLESWRGKPFSKEEYGKFDIFVLIGKGCMLGIMHTEKNDRVYANITSIMNLPTGIKAPLPINFPLKFSLSEFDQNVYDSLSDYLKTMIAKSPEYAEIKGLNSHDPNTDNGDQQRAEEPDDSGPIPF